MGAKRLGLKIEAKRLGGKRPGGNVMEAKRLVTAQTTLFRFCSIVPYGKNGTVVQKHGKTGERYIFEQ